MNGAPTQVHTPIQKSLVGNSAPGSQFELVNDFDYVMVFINEAKPDGSYKQSKYAKDCCYAMINAGLELYTYMSVQNDEMIVLIRAPLEVLATFADKMDFNMKLDATEARRRLEAGSEEKNKWGVQIIQGVQINEDSRFGKFYGAFEHIFGKYESDDQRLFDSSASTAVPPNPFTPLIRLKLIYFLLEASPRIGGCKLPLQTLLHSGKLAAFFPTHDNDLAEKLMHLSMNCCTLPWSFPLEEIRNYFGEKYALFFAFTGHYAHTLQILGLIGLVWQLVVWGTRNFSHPVLPFYGLVIAIWSICMLEYWKRLQADYALKWGMSRFEDTEPDRAEFTGEDTTSVINGEPYRYYPAQTFKNKLRLSTVIILAYIGCVLGVIAGIYVFRFKMQSDFGGYASTAASILNAIQILIFNFFYQYITIDLTNYENHRTDTSYEDAMIAKLFVFQFVNSYASFFFLAFIAPYLPKPSDVPSYYLGQCGASNCMEPLSINLAIIFGTNLLVTNAINFVTPWITYKMKKYSETAGVDATLLTPAELDYVLVPYNALLDGINNYADMAVQYGFMALFVVALPISPFLSLINCYVKLKFLMWKQLSLYQRPVPMGGQDIGTWQTIFSIISGVAVITNAALIVFTMSVVTQYSTMGRLWIFIGFQWVLFLMQGLISAFIDDVPTKVTVQLARTEFIVSKLIEKQPDEGSDEAPEQEEVLDDGGDDEAKGGDPAGVAPKNKIMKLKHRGKPPVPVLEKPLKDGVPLDGVYNCFVYNKKTIKDRVAQLAQGSSRRSISADLQGSAAPSAKAGEYELVPQTAENRV